MQNKLNARSKGFVLTFEAIITTLIFSLLLLSISQTPLQTLKELTILQQANDLLRVWSATNTNESEMITDLKSVFENNADLWINSEVKFWGQKKNEAVATEGIILDYALNEIKVKIIIYYN